MNPQRGYRPERNLDFFISSIYRYPVSIGGPTGTGGKYKTYWRGCSMKFLHTSDWHLGRCLYGRKRYDAFSAFLDWLVRTIEDERIEALLVVGDVFDTRTPGNLAQALYYRFLCRVSASCCRHVVVVAGNHDSPSFLNAPRELLRTLNVYVVGSMTDVPEDEVIILYKDEQPEAIVCAVPYLRDKDIRMVEPGETIDDKNIKLIEGLKKHYADICGLAEQKRSEFEKAGHKGIPIIAMGHLFTAGGQTIDGDGVRELYAGSLAHVGEEAFPLSIDYLALGHLHVPQSVGSTGHIRYSGSPIPMGYGEATQQKSVVIVDFGRLETSDLTFDRTIKNQQSTIRIFPVPCFQQLIRIEGSLDDILKKIDALKRENSRAWLEIEYTGSDVIGDLRDIIVEALAGSAMEAIRIKNRRVMDRVIHRITEDETLDDLDPGDIFVRCLDAFDVPDEDRGGLTVSYHEIITSLHEEDLNAE